MRPGNEASAGYLKKMNRVFFDVSPDGDLVYMDPMIGVLCNTDRRIVVQLNTQDAVLELRLGSQTVQTFPLVPSVAQACLSASGAYFALFERLCRTTPEMIVPQVLLT